MNLGEFIDTFKDAIARRVVASYPPLYRPSENGHKLPRLLRRPLGAQADAIRGAALSLQAHRGTTVVGEMGTGKTFIATAAAHMAGFRRVLVLCPPHLTRKWKREVEETVPSARTAIVTSITDLERLRYSVGAGPLFAVMSREKAKLSYRWMPAVNQRWATSNGRLVRNEETGEPFRIPCCPGCTTQIVDKDGVPLTDADLNRRKHTCAGCGGPLWQADKSGPARYPLADYVKHRIKGFFDLLIGDEVHEYKGRGSAQGIAAGVLADVCGKSLSLSGTLMGGYSSTLLHLLSSMDSEEDATGYSRRSAYATVFEELRRKLADALSRGSKRLLSTYLQTLLAYPDGCTRGETVLDPESGEVIVQVPPLSEEKLYPKEKSLVDLVAKERMEGRRVLVYVTHTGTRDITGRMDDILTRHGFRVAVMKADAVAPDRREAWVADRVQLVFIVPRQRLAVSARYLSTHYGRMRCWAFPDQEREVFDQVVLMGYRKADPVPGRPRGAHGAGVGGGGAGAAALPPLHGLQPGDHARRGHPLHHPHRRSRRGRCRGAVVGAVGQHGDHRLPLARRGHPHPPADAPQKGHHGDAGGGAGFLQQPRPRSRRAAHPGQGPHLEGGGHGGGQPREGGPP